MIKQFIAEQPVGTKLYLRLQVLPGGCQGFMHKLDLDPATSSDDCICETAGVRVVVFKRQVETLRGTQIDFGDIDGKQGFKVEKLQRRGSP